MSKETQALIRKKCTELADLLVRKNEGYGDSALEPVRVFSRASASAGLLVRMDDKLSRIRNRKDGEAVDEDTFMDLAGYLILFMIQRDGTREGVDGPEMPFKRKDLEETGKAIKVYWMGWEEVYKRLRAWKPPSTLPGDRALRVWGLPRGGAIVAGLLCAMAPVLMVAVETPEEADLIVDDIRDTGRAHAHLCMKYPTTPFWFLVNRDSEKAVIGDLWIHFPWEKVEEVGRG